MSFDPEAFDLEHRLEAIGIDAFCLCPAHSDEPCQACVAEMQFRKCWRMAKAAGRREVLEALMSPELREDLADLEHKRWSGWMQYQFSKCVKLSSGKMVIQENDVAWWRSLMALHYDALTEKSKDSDRAEVTKIITLILRNLAAEGEAEEAKGK